LDDSEFRPEPRRPKRNYYRLALGAALSILVVKLGSVVGKEAVPLLALVKEELPSPTEQIQAVMAQLHIGETERKRPAKLPETHPRKRHHVNQEVEQEVEEEAPVAALPPYKGTVRAQLTLTPLYSYRPFQVELRDAHSRKKMEVGEPKPLTVDIDDPEPATLSIAGGAEPAPPPAAFSLNVDLSGPEADRIADVLEPTGGAIQNDPPARKYQDERSVGLAAVVDKTGRVASIRRVNGSAALAQAAIDTVRRTRYKPFLENGHPVEMQTFVTVEFTIPRN
jgi:outer membrane biosynthesis protein TonB